MTISSESSSDDRHAIIQQYRRIEDLLPAHWTQAKVQANGIDQQYYRTGGDKPALVLLHGYMASALSWLRVAKALEHDYDVILIDARGHGLSDRITSGFNQTIRREDAAGVIQALRLAPAHVLGHSTGAGTALDLAAGYPELVRTLLLEDSSTYDPPVEHHTGSPGSYFQTAAFQAWYTAWVAWLEQLKTQTHEERLLSSLAQRMPGQPIDEEEYVPWVEGSAQLDLEMVRRSLDLPPEADTRTDVVDVRTQIHCPVLVLRASTMQPVFAAPQQQVEELPCEWSNVRYMRFPNTGHLIHAEQFGLFIGVVRAFLATHTPTPSDALTVDLSVICQCLLPLQAATMSLQPTAASGQFSDQPATELCHWTHTINAR